MAFPSDPATLVAIASVLTAAASFLREIRYWLESWLKPKSDKDGNLD
jgi:hypothetical protein